MVEAGDEQRAVAEQDVVGFRVPGVAPDGLAGVGQVDVFDAFADEHGASVPVREHEIPDVVGVVDVVVHLGDETAAVAGVRRELGVHAGVAFVRARRLVHGLTATTTPPKRIDVPVSALEPQTGDGMRRFSTVWLASDTRYAVVVNGQSTVGYRYRDITATGPTRQAEGWAVAPDVFTTDVGAADTVWDTRAPGTDDRGTVVLRIEGDTEPTAVREMAVGEGTADGGPRRGYSHATGGDYGAFVEPGSSTAASFFFYGGDSNVVRHLHVGETGVELWLRWRQNFDKRLPTDPVREFAGAGLALDDARGVGNHGFFRHFRVYRWEQSWLDVNAPWLSAVGYAGTLPVGLRTVEASCPEPDAVTATLSGLTVTSPAGAAVELDMMFDPAKRTCEASVPGSAGAHITVAATLADYGAVLFFVEDGVAIPDADPDAAGHQIALEGALTTIRMDVVVDRGQAETCTLKVTRVNVEAGLSALTVTDGPGNVVPLRPSFSPSIGRYRVLETGLATPLTVVATRKDDAASVAYFDENGIPLVEEDGTEEGFQLAAAATGTVLRMVVTASDNVTTASYEISFTGVVPVQATVDGARVVLDYGVALGLIDVPAASAYVVQVDERATLVRSTVTVEGRTLTLTLPVAVGVRGGRRR